MPGKRTVRRYEDENNTTDGEKSWPFPCIPPRLASQRRPAYPRWTRQAPQKRNFSNTKAKTDIYQTVTDSIIVALEANVKPWECPWQYTPGISGLPCNYATGTAYSGMNIMLLWSSASEQGFSDSRWMTYKQAQAEGGQVRKGEHGTTAIFYTTVEKENDDGETDYIPMLKTFTVFNVEQIDGLPLSDEAVFPAETFEPIPRAEALFRSSGATIIEKGQNAFFAPLTDEIRLPERRLFTDVANFYATGLHELVHWTGAKAA